MIRFENYPPDPRDRSGIDILIKARDTSRKTIEITSDINPRYDCSLFQYEPVIQPGSHEYLHHMTLYECRGDQGELESAAKTDGSVCYVPDKPAFQCNTIAATWSLGSEVRRKLHSHTRATPSASILANSTELRKNLKFRYTELVRCCLYRLEFIRFFIPLLIKLTLKVPNRILNFVEKGTVRLLNSKTNRRDEITSCNIVST